jgi:hypothetical protein
MYLLGAHHEITGLDEDTLYYVRVRAENGGSCDSVGMKFIDDCGAYALASPSSITPMKAPLNSSEVTATVTSETSVDVTWIPPSSSGTIASYRVDRYTKSAEASVYSSFFGDAEVQTVKSSGTNVSAGTFTLSYDSWDVTLPGTVSGLNGLYYFNTTNDLTSYLEPGDQIYVDGAAYTIATGNLFTNDSFYVAEPITANVTNSDISGAAIYMRPKTLPIPFDVTPTKMVEM